MALFKGTHQQYYQGNNHGDYQFVSLHDIINQFMVVYVGEGKIIPKINRTDVAFHAQRALAELSFDTFKSVKAHEIVLPSTLQMILPHDYVNYTKLSWVDSSGIKHPLYPTKHTSNPFDINQDSFGNYTFELEPALGVNMYFDDPLMPPWEWITPTPATATSGTHSYGSNQAGWTYYSDEVSADSNTLTFKQYVKKSWTRNLSLLYCVWQQLDVSNVDIINLSSTGTAQDAVAANADGTASATHGILGGNLKIGFTSSPPHPNKTLRYTGSTNYTPNENLQYLTTSAGNSAYLEWQNGESAVVKTLEDENAIDVSSYNTIYVVITSAVDFEPTTTTPASQRNIEHANTFGTNSIDDIIITSPISAEPLGTNSTRTSTTWDNYKSITPSENNNDNYEDEIYWPNEGERYGLEPSHAQVNGSFYIDERLGKINFSSNINGKTVILDYISDSLGTEEEMKAHKFAEEAMYKCIAYAVVSTSSYAQQLAPRFKKEKFAAVRQAKLRLSNIKLEEITQILRGKSKQIKH